MASSTIVQWWEGRSVAGWESILRRGAEFPVPMFHYRGGADLDPAILPPCCAPDSLPSTSLPDVTST